MPAVPSNEEIANGQFASEVKMVQLGKITYAIFLETLRDMPYFGVMLLVLVMMPWRINYLLKAISCSREDPSNRRQILQLLRNVAKDYACVAINVVLLLSGFKTKKALLLIKRNFRLNFFVGFLKYSYLL